jgi:ethanolamine ammonia-lyase large subunit
LNYQSTSYHDAVSVRRILGLRPAPEFMAWLESFGIYRNGQLAVGCQQRLLDRLSSVVAADLSK